MATNEGGDGDDPPTSLSVLLRSFYSHSGPIPVGMIASGLGFRLDGHRRPFSPSRLAGHVRGGAVWPSLFAAVCALVHYIPRGILAFAGGGHLSLKSRSISIIGTHSTSWCPFTHSMKRSSMSRTSDHVGVE